MTTNREPQPTFADTLAWLCARGASELAAVDDLSTNLARLVRGLDAAEDAVKLTFQGVDKGLTVSAELLVHLERLTQATLRTVPTLQRTELDVLRLVAEGGDVAPEVVRGIGVLRSRAQETSRELHNALRRSYQDQLTAEVVR